MDQASLNRTVFLIERTDVPLAFPTQDLPGKLLSSTANALIEQRMLSAFLTGLLLGGRGITR
jgi:hypothetical protein